MKQIRSKLSDKREKKLKYDYKMMEKLVEEFLHKYNIDAEMEIYIQKIIDEKIDLDLAYKNITSKRKYQPQFGAELFKDIKDYLETFVNQKIDEEIKDMEKSGEPEEKIKIHEEILKNNMSEIKLTMFEKGIKRSTLTAYHYFLKVLHKNTEAFMNLHNYKKINGIKNPNELLAKEIYTIIGNDDEMTRFVVTLKNLIEQWLIKYSSKTKIGDFYYDIMMITPEYIVEKILKYLTMVAIKNKNPMTLRAIFSSYITLIHKNLFSFYAANLSKVKIGYFRQLENLFTENFDLIHEEKGPDPKKGIIDIMAKVYLFKNKRYLKKDMEFLNNDFFSNVFEINNIDMLYKYQYPKKVNILDHMYLYGSIYKYSLGQDDKPIHRAMVINKQFLKKNNKKKNFLYIKEKLIKKLFTVFYNIFGDKESSILIIDNIAKDLMEKINFDFYLDPDTMKPLKLNFNEYLDIIDNFINDITRVILHEDRINLNEKALDKLNVANLILPNEKETDLNVI